MKLKDQSSNIWGQTPSDSKDAILWIERAGRTCYRSEDKIVEGSGRKFVENIWKRTHYSVLEHSNIVIRTKEKSKFPDMTLIKMKGVFDSSYFNFCTYQDRVYVGGNWRTWIEFFARHNVTLSIADMPNIIRNTNEYELVQFNDIPNQLKAITVEFFTDRATTHEIVRHRPVSYSQESQRYVRYGDITYIKPWWYKYTFRANQEDFMSAMCDSEDHYKYLIDHGQKPEEARAVLPNATATKIIMTTIIPEWKHVFKLRTSKAAYPQIRKLMIPVVEEFITNDWI
jgi:thymidylate synthase (FAD)